MVTINTQQVYKADDQHRDADAACFEDVINDVLQNIQEYVKILEGTHAWSTEYIKNVDCDYAIEFGEERGALHAHVLIKIQHDTRVHLDFAKIKTKVKEALGLENIYLDSRLVRPSSDDWILGYLGKMR